ncbi:MAG: hypothetical protein VBE63_01000 [Lamprobacter sp.]|uniref:hypothetical protein n=1 Tax=Lamprobacter sp. TaxID=3100796 RepID=UPI002B264109|nr:hypothetical protein [Lamprobacter sp.]MEA3638503.1 hypothetical protein [Lamprobacter sp.]
MQLIKARCRENDAGSSLVELMIGITIGMMIIASTLTIYATTGYGASATLGSAKLNVELRGAMDVMVEDIRRAGFGRDGATLTFMSSNSDIAVYDSDADNVNDCVVYSYQPPSGVVTTFGFRIVENVVRMRNSSANLTGTVADCTTANAWEALTDANTVIIDAIESGANYFDISYQCLLANRPTGATIATTSPASQSCTAGSSLYDEAAVQATATSTPIALVEIRYVSIRLEGHLTQDDSMRMALAQSVMVRNHRIEMLNP